MESNPDNIAPWHRVPEEIAAGPAVGAEENAQGKKLEPAEGRETNPELVSELSGIRKSKFAENPERNLERFARQNDFTDSIKLKYPDESLDEYELYHILIGSGSYEDIVKHVDLPGGEIEDFIRNGL